MDLVDCLDAGRQTELEFVHSLRGRQVGECRGPLVEIELPARLAERLEDSFCGNVAALDILTESLHVACGTSATFRLCVAHWLDLAHVSVLHGQEHRNRQWVEVADNLFQRACRTAGWDPKELSNMLVWQRAKLT